MSTPVGSLRRKSQGDSMLLYGSIWQTSGAETPLTIVDPGFAASSVIVTADVIQTYQQIIFDLQRQVLRYEALLEYYLRGERAEDEIAVEPSTPLSAASLGMVNSILRVRLTESSVLRAYDEEET
jgi:hypothetical protein